VSEEFVRDLPRVEPPPRSRALPEPGDEPFGAYLPHRWNATHRGPEKRASGDPASHRIYEGVQSRAAWRRTTLATLFAGYTGYYFCRSNLSVAGPHLLSELGPLGFDKATFGLIATVGTAAYFLGKLVNGIVIDFAGGRRMFLLGMIASVVFTVIFGSVDVLAIFVLAWALNRFVQSMGWSALVKIASRWFSFREYGTVMGILSLSFLFGDALARLVLGELLHAGIGWRGMFHSAAAILLGIAAVTAFTLKSSPRDAGLEEPESNPTNVFAGDGGAKRPKSPWSLIAPLTKSRSFWVVATLSLGLTLIRESFNLWTPTYLAEAAGIPKEQAGTYSLYFPFFGGVSVLAAGIVTDRVLGGRRGSYMVVSLILLVVVLAFMSTLRDAPTRKIIPHVLVSLVALLMTGPYSFLAGAMSLDLGGKTGSATAAGLIDAIGYLGGMLSGLAVGWIAEKSGWASVFAFLAAVAFFTALAAIFYFVSHDRARSELTPRREDASDAPRSRIP
jgi:MFS transporter, OPA family, glycerol-3-phosphate transporter